MTREELRGLSTTIDTMMDLGRRDEAEQVMATALQESAHDPAYHLFFQAEAAGYFEGDHRKRERLLAEGVRTAPEDAFMLRNMGVCHLLDEKLSRARRRFEEALRAEPRDADTLRCLGLICSMRGKESRAMEWYRQALAVKPDDNDAMRQMGVSYSKLGQDRDAIDWYRRALECCDHDYDAMRQMGISFAMLGDYPTALTWLNLALTVNPGDLESKRNMKLVQRKQGGRDDAFGGALMTKVARALTLAWRRFINRLG
jgi:Flp pilus assembly protein TadD